jgi:hypothetical protein
VWKAFRPGETVMVDAENDEITLRSTLQSGGSSGF